MSTSREREKFQSLLQAWSDYIDDEDGNLDGMLDAIRALGSAMGFDWIGGHDGSTTDTT